MHSKELLRAGVKSSKIAFGKFFIGDIGWEYYFLGLEMEDILQGMS